MENAFYGITHNKIIENLVWRSRRDSLMCRLKIAVQYLMSRDYGFLLDAITLGKKITDFMTDCVGIKLA